MTTETQQKEKLRVVLDTNVYISIFINPTGELGAIWEHALKDTYTLLISPALVAELANVLRGKFMWPEEALKARIRRFARMADIIRPTIVPNIIENDPADNHILACAMSGKADVIVSGDKRRLLRVRGDTHCPARSSFGCLGVYRGTAPAI